MNEKIQFLQNEFLNRFGGSKEDIHYYYSPGRVNLIGEHIDYNGGKVFPCALTFGTWGAIRLREDDKLLFESVNFPHRVEVSLHPNEYRREDGWSNYPKGVIKEFQMLGAPLTGMEIMVYGEIPNGSGLSSSASLEVLIATMLNDLFECHMDKVTLTKMCQHSENTFNKVNCGIMDQFSVGLGRENKAILLDCASLNYEYVPLELGNVAIVIGNTKKKRGLADSKYNERREQCESALADLQKKLDIQALCELSVQEFEENKHLIADPVCRKRAEHAVYENDRVLKAVEVLGRGDIPAFGKLMNQSHDSLRDLYEVTGKELDAMVEEARRVPGTLGSRMTGAGFGGCTVSLVAEDHVDEFIRQVGYAYKQRTGLEAEFYVAKAGQGACRVDEPIEFLVEELLAYGLKEKLLENPDVVYVRNQLLELLQLSAPFEKTDSRDGGILPCREAFEQMEQNLRLSGLESFHEGMKRAIEAGEKAYDTSDQRFSPAPILGKILDYMAGRGLTLGESIEERDLMDAKIMGLLMARPSEAAAKFEALRQDDPVKASEYFYHLSRASHYVMDERIEKNLYWQTATEYGDMEITINLSKPEKDPRVIARMLQMKNASYPKCLLCPENVGYAGRLGHPARQNLRQMPLSLEGENWFLQYSPYTYYNEHCILLKGEHVPMKISTLTFKRLFDFIELLPHYFMGSNAGLPVVGGSILTHEHYQGGHHVFAMEKAKPIAFYTDEEHPDVTVSIVNWAMSCIRLSGASREHVISVASHVLDFWEAYTDASCGIFAETQEDGKRVPHNAITPIARFNKQGEYELDLVLRNNLTSEKYPDGIFHPHPELHHIKKENIGLIEVMGLAVLPGRLQKELSLIQEILTGRDEASLTEDEKKSLLKHQPWIEDMKGRYGTGLEQEEARGLLKHEVGRIFKRVLEDCAVFKHTEEGMACFESFMKAAGFTGRS
ncbi:MAG: galactokinase [Firmicutes bacterium]|nr:galactokinase [Bacillota bacterium]